VSKPEIPQAMPWSDLERLNKEKEYVGIYLSAHPLDEYKYALEFGCNTTMAEFANPSSLYGREIVVGGIVTGGREGLTRKGAPYGSIRLEDYSGTNEFMLFGKDYVDYANYRANGLYLLISGRFMPRPFKQDELEFKIQKIELLNEVHERLLESLTIELPLSEIHGVMVDTLRSLVTDNRHSKTKLYFEVFDPETQHSVKLFSRSHNIKITKELIAALESDENLCYKINDRSPKE
jgi:DNA polymerase-3 subunit alpha